MKRFVRFMEAVPSTTVPNVVEEKRALCARFPGHGIPLRVNQDMVSECPICQKDRLPISALLHAATRETLFQHMRTIGMDHRSITAHDKEGYVGLFLIVELDTTGLSYPRLLCPYCCHNRFSPLLHLRCLCLYPIPGSAFMADVVKDLNRYRLGVWHLVSIVGRHESNGTEHVHDERLIHRWASDAVLPLINHSLATTPNQELLGLSPIEL